MGAADNRTMFESPLEYCPFCREYVALDVTQSECAVRHACKDVRCPLAQYFTGPRGEVAQGETRMCPVPVRALLSPESLSLLKAIAESGETAFSGPDLMRMLHKAPVDTDAPIGELTTLGLLRISYENPEERGYELTAAGRRFVSSRFDGGLQRRRFGERS